MESAAAVDVFSRSFKNDGLGYTKYYGDGLGYTKYYGDGLGYTKYYGDGLGYTKYYGDGDSLSFSMVDNIYQSTKIVKFERVGNRLRKFRQRVKGLGGKDKTTLDSNRKRQKES